MQVLSEFARRANRVVAQPLRGSRATAESGPWFHHLIMPWLIARVLNAKGRHAFVAEIQFGRHGFRSLLARSVLPYFPDLTTHSFSDDAISFTLADLTRAESVGRGVHVSHLNA